MYDKPIPMGARSKSWVCGYSFAGIAGSSPAGGMDVCLSCVSVVCYQAEVFATSQSLVQRSTTEWCVCVCVWSRNLNNIEEAKAH